MCVSTCSSTSYLIALFFYKVPPTFVSLLVLDHGPDKNLFFQKLMYEVGREKTETKRRISKYGRVRRVRLLNVLGVVLID